MLATPERRAIAVSTRPPGPSPARVPGARWVLPISALAITILVFSSVTMRTALLDDDGGPLNAYGFPLPWHRWALFSSLHRDVDVIALVADFVLHLAVVTAAVAALRSKVQALRSPPGWVAGLLVALALTSAGLLAIHFHSPHARRFGADETYRTAARHLHLGWQFPY